MLSSAVEFLGTTSFPAFIWYDVKGKVIPYAMKTYGGVDV
jgi:hypothetical protein